MGSDQRFDARIPDLEAAAGISFHDDAIGERTRTKATDMGGWRVAVAQATQAAKASC